MRRVQGGWGLLCLALLAALAFTAELVVGSAGLSPGSALRALFTGGDSFAHMIVVSVRLPRAMSALAVGALLSLAGVLLQALFRNPLADPLVLGVSGGAAVGALLGLLLGASVVTAHWYATLGGSLVAVTVLLLGRGGGSLRLLLCGVLLASACGALITVLLTLADTGQLRGMVFWLAGDLNWAQHPLAELGTAAVAMAIAIMGGRWLNVLGAGELRSVTLGLPAGAARIGVFVFSAALTSVAVMAGGLIGFVGLIAPHLVRMAFGSSDHRLVAPAAALAGGTLLCTADVLARAVAAPRELPVGAVMALIGAPVFIALLRRQQR